MAGVRFSALQSRPIEFLDCTSVTLHEWLLWGFGVFCSRGRLQHTTHG